MLILKTVVSIAAHVLAQDIDGDFQVMERFRTCGCSTEHKL